MTARIHTRKLEVESEGDKVNSDLAQRVDTEIAAHEGKIEDYENNIADYRDKIRSTQLVIAQLRRIRRQLGNILAAPQDRPVSGTGTRGSKKPPVGKRRYRPGSDAYIVLTVARDAIRAAGQPLDRNQIIAAIEASGHKLKSMNPEQYVNKVMWGSEEFRNVGDGYDFSEAGGSEE